MTANIKEIIAEMREKDVHATPKEFWQLSMNRTSDQVRANEDFILFVRNNIPAILDYVASLEKQNADLKDDLNIHPRFRMEP